MEARLLGGSWAAEEGSTPASQVSWNPPRTTHEDPSSGTHVRSSPTGGAGAEEPGGGTALLFAFRVRLRGRRNPESRIAMDDD